MPDFSSRIRECRKRKGLTQSQVAKELGIATRTFQDYERGVRFPTFEGFLAIVNYFGVTSNYLTGSTNSPDTYLLDPEEIFDVWPGESEIDHIYGFITSSGKEIELTREQSLRLHKIRQEIAALSKELADKEDEEDVKLYLVCRSKPPQRDNGDC